MNEPKKRGRPPKRVEGEDVKFETDAIPEALPPFVAPEVPNAFAQAFAKAVWDAQSPTEPRAWRLERVAVAMANKGFSMEGIAL